MVIKGEVVRQASTPLGTPGRMTLENGFSCDTLELAWHNNERGRSCTAAGVERGRVWWSPMLKRLVIRYADRNGRHDCLCHNGNFAADEEDLDGDGVPEVTQIHGCTEVGRGYGDVKRKDGKMQWGITRSVAALEELITSLRDESVETGLADKDGFVSGYHEVEIVYRWADGSAP